MAIIPVSNKFIKGLKNTIDPKMFDSNSWTFPTENIRIMNLKGQGFVVSYMPSNSNPNTIYGEEFRLSDGFHCVGACDWNGIAYIFSHNLGTGEGEIGCFPAPDTNGTNFSGYTSNSVRKYSPLRNFKISGTISNFRTTKFNFFDTIENRVRMVQCFARLDYDQSVNIYFVDHNNVDRVINSGFNQDGVSTNRFYTDSNFDNFIPLIPQTSVIGTLTASVQPGGFLKFGMYYVFLRYLTSDYNRTPFYLQSGSLQVYDGSLDVRLAQGGLYNKVSDKKISLILNNLDTDYTYYELAYVRYYSDNNNPIQYETGLIDEYFLISNLTPEIKNNDDILPIQYAEILSLPNKEIVSKSITQNENVAFKCNTKEFNTHHESLKEIAWRILPFTYVATHEDKLVRDNSSFDVQYLEHKDPTLTYNIESYFGGEIYALGVVFGFAGGYESEVYPIRGIDNWDGSITTVGQYTANPHSITNPNENLFGIYRLPSRCVNGYYLYTNVSSSSYVNLLGLNLDITLAKTYINSSDGAWFRSNIKYIRFVRANRKECLLGQGLAMAVATPATTDSNAITDWCSQYDAVDNVMRQYTPWNINYDPGCFDYFDATNHKYWSTQQASPGNFTRNALKTTALAPIYRGYLPMVEYQHRVIESDTSRCYVDRMSLVYQKYGIYVPDFIFTGMNKDTSNIVKMMSIGSTVMNLNISNKEDNWNHFNSITYNQELLYYTSTPSNLIFPIYDFAEIKGRYIPKTVQVKSVNCKWVGVPSLTFPNSNPQSLNGSSYYNAAYDNSIANDHIVLNDHSQNSGISTQDWCSNRAIRLLPYIACEVSESETSTFHENLNIVNLYNVDPTTITGTTLASYYNIQSEKYYEITDGVIPMLYNISNQNINSNNFILWRGDCFVQRTWFKQMDWLGSQLELSNSVNAIGIDFNINVNRGAADYASSKQALYACGLVLSIITENKVNTAMRIDNYLGGNTYYPKNSSDGYWPIKPFISSFAESFIANHGYDVTHSGRYWFLYNMTSPYNSIWHPTRIRHSYVNEPGSYIDGYRSWDVASFIDYDMDGGEMYKVVAHRKTLLSVQKYVTNQHYTNQQQEKVASNTGELIVGTGPVLSKDVRKFNFGTQHIDSIVVTDEGIYGVDALRRVIWDVKLTTTQMGSSLFAGGDISTAKEIEARLIEILEGYYKRTDIISEKLFLDRNYDNIGIFGWSNPKYREVVFTFLNPSICVGDDCDVWITPAIGIEQECASGGYYEWLISTNYRKGAIKYYEVVSGSDIVSSHLYYHHPNSNGLINMDTSHNPYENSITADPEWTMIDVRNIVLFQNNQVYDSFTVGYIGCCDSDIAYAICLEKKYLFHLYGQQIVQPDPSHPLPVLTYNPSTALFSTSDSSSYYYENTIPQQTNRIQIHCHCNQSASLIFNEEQGFFTSETSIRPYAGFNINKDTFTFLPTNYTTTGRCYKSDASDTEVLNIWNHNKEGIITWIVNGMNDQQDMSKYNKQFLSYNIVGSELNYLGIEYMTDMQVSIHSWAEYYWATPEYFENEWRVPILGNTVISPNGEYDVESNMVGHHLYVTLKYKSNTNGFIKEIITNFAISFA